MTSARRLLSGSVYSSIGAAVSKGAAILSTVILARFLGPTNLGIYSVYMVTGAAMLGISHFGITHAMHKYVAEEVDRDKKRLQSLLSAGLIVTLIAQPLGFLILFSVANSLAIILYRDEQLGFWIRLAAVQMLLSGIATFLMGIIYGFQEFKRYTWVTLFASLAGLLLTVLLVPLWNLSGAVLASLLVFSITLLMTVQLLRRVMKARGLEWSTESSPQYIARLLRFGFPVALTNFVSAPISLVLQGSLSQIGGLQDVGFIRVGQSIYNIVTFLPVAVSAPAIAAFSRASVHDDRLELSGLVLLNTRIIWMILLPIIVSLSMATEPVLMLLFGSQFQGATPVVAVMTWTALWVSLFGIGLQVNQALAKTWMFFFLAVIQPFVFLLLASRLIQSHHALGYVLAEQFSFIVPLLIQFIFLKSHALVGSTEAISRLFLLTLCSVALVASSYLLISDMFARIVLSLLAFLGIVFWEYAYHLTGVEKTTLFQIVKGKWDGLRLKRSRML